MTRAFSLLLFISMTLVSYDSFSKVSIDDAYNQCMSRTKHDRTNCQAGCGMIVQQCYDEGIAETNKKMDEIKDEITRKSGEKCGKLLADYLSEAARMEATVEKQAVDIVGWIGSELTFSFSKQRLDNLLLIKKLCRD